MDGAIDDSCLAPGAARPRRQRRHDGKERDRNSESHGVRFSFTVVTESVRRTSVSRPRVEAWPSPLSSSRAPSAAQSPAGGSGAARAAALRDHGRGVRAGHGARRQACPARPLLRLVDVEAEEAERIPTGVDELDRVLGGGLVPASLVLVGGEPGVGKSTLLLIGARRHLAASGGRCSSPARSRSAQVKLRAARLGGCERRRDPGRDRARRGLRDARARAARRLRDRLGADALLVRARLRARARWRRCARPPRGCCGSRRRRASRTFLVGHVTKDGTVAGPRVLEHLVDCVLQFEGDRYHAHRILRAVKNRFGSTNELGVFEMTGTGLVGVPDPSAALRRSEAGEVGAAVTCTIEGTRPLLLEIQALVAPSDLAMPRRVATGVDPKRLAMILAVLVAPRGPAARQCRRLRQRRGRRPDRRARRRPRDRSRDRLGGARTSPVRDGHGGLRRDRAHRPPPAGDAGRAAARGVPRSSVSPTRRRPGDQATDGATPRPVETLRRRSERARRRARREACLSRDFP